MSKTTKKVVRKSQKPASEPVGSVRSDPKASIVEPLIHIEGHNNAFKAQLDSDPESELIAVGYSRVNGTNTYSAYTIHVKGGRVSKIICEEPNLKGIAEESAKISFVSNFTDNEE